MYLANKWEHRRTHLIEAVLTPVADINDFDDLSNKTGIKHVTLAQFGLEVGTTRQDETSDVDLVINDEVLDRQFGNLPDVIVTLLVT